jgi:hypothetical protein
MTLHGWGAAPLRFAVVLPFPTSGAPHMPPRTPDGVAAGHTGEPSTFEPEEDEQAPDK